MLKNLKTFYAKDARTHLPWRKTTDPYKLLVSEVMLQQTQVDRVIPYYERWVKKYPTSKALSKASLSDVLRLWSGLGYNRRARFLHEAAKLLAQKGFPKTAEEIETLPGVGHYTARAVAAFAYNSPEVFIETNIRTVFFHHDASGRKLSDAQLLPLVAGALKRSRMEPRDFYWALMDYGSYLKRSGVKLNRRSRHYAKQSTFEGSARQLRGAIVRELLRKPQTETQLIKNLSRNRKEVKRELAKLLGERMIRQARKRYEVGG